MKVLRNILAIVIGIIVGSIVNMFIVMKGPLPEGVNMENLSTSMHLFETKHFVLPILGHALGTLAGAILAALIAFSHKFKFAMTIGIFFLVGGIANIFILNFPLFPAIIDLLVAYVPMAFIGWKISTFFQKESLYD